ncbi:MAG TPA: hypothetical protein VN240_04290, partial [Propylenella sp.]|nr:hypothetical protein [Propylenella sp.]
RLKTYDRRPRCCLEAQDWHALISAPNRRPHYNVRFCRTADIRSATAFSKRATLAEPDAARIVCVG